MRLATIPAIGFVGLGTMGIAMARRLIDAGMDPLLWNRGAKALDPFRAAGARIAPTPEALIRASDIVILMLSDDSAVGEVLGLDDPGRSRALADRIIVNMGTGSPEGAIAHQLAIAAAGGTYVEAPVSGSRKPAEDGRLVAIVAGGDSEQRALVRDLIAPMCRASIDAGDVPRGLRMKLAVNLYLVATVAALAEAFHLAERLGIDLHRFAELVEAGPMASEVVISKGRKIADRDFSVQATIRDVHKNCRLVADAAARAGAMTPLLARARALFASRERAGEAELDMAAVIDSFHLASGSDADRVVARRLGAYQRKDLHAFLRCWSDTAIIVGPDSALLARGVQAIRDRHQRRFADPALEARLVARTAVGSLVVDEEIVTRTAASGAIEEVRVLGVYRVEDGRIVEARFEEEIADGQ